MTPAQQVAALGETVWGRNWPSGMARLIGANPRNLQRLQAAVRAGQDYRTAPAILVQAQSSLLAAAHFG